MKNNLGFTLIETMVALVIIGLIALMASQGLSGAFNVKGQVERKIFDHEKMMVMMKYFMNDCEKMLTNMDQKLPPTFIKGNKYNWIIRYNSLRDGNGWQIIGYAIESNSFNRYISKTYSNKQEAVDILEGLSKDPDLGLKSTQISYQIPQVDLQNIDAIWSPISNKSPLGLKLSLTFKGSSSPLKSSCIAEGNL
jgi:prepilin-type N-terminal cleavage/methylation domain-containing protein